MGRGGDALIAWRLVVSRLVSGVLVAHAGGALVLALAVAVEARGGELATLLRARVPPGWALAASVLTLLGSALAMARMRRAGIVLGLGTLGVGPWRSVLVAGVLGALVGAGAGQVLRPPPDLVGWERIPGGWQHAGEVVPDLPGAVVAPRVSVPVPVVPTPSATLSGAAGGALGAALGLYGGAMGPVVVGALLLVGEAVSGGLVERNVWPGVARLLPALLLGIGLAARRLLAPIFPRR